MSGAKRITISGYYGFKNAGDEAVLAGLILAFQSVASGADIKITALSIDPVSTRSEHGIESAHRYKLGPLMRTIASCNLLISGGGSLLQDVTSAHGIFYYLGVIRAAQILGKKTMMAAQGIGPLTLPRSRKLTASVARRCDAITVRDPTSAALLREIGVNMPEIIVTADPALLLGNSRSATTHSGVSISLRDWSSSPSNFPQQVAQACCSVIGAPLISSMIMSPTDSEIHDRFFDSYNQFLGLASGKLHGSDSVSWSELSHIAASSEMVIGMRLHALILATASGTPSVALSYDPKVNAFMEMSGQSDAVYDIRENDPQLLAELISKVWIERHERAIKLQAILPRLRSAAIQNAEIALSLLA